MRARTIFPVIAASAAVVAAGALGAACSLTTSLDGLSNGAYDDAALDAPASTDGPTRMPETGVADASEEGDAPEEGEASSPASTFRCADHAAAVFCADFESGLFNSGWTNTYTSNGGTLALGGGRFGRGLVATVPTRADPIQSMRPSATVEEAINLAPRAPMTLAFDMKVESAASGGGVLDIGGIDFHGAFYVVTFRMENDGTIHLHEYGDPIAPNPEVQTNFPFTVQPAFGSWVSVAMRLTFPTATSARLVVVFDGATAYDGPIAASPYASQPFVFAGINNAEGAAQARTVDFDDILVTTP